MICASSTSHVSGVLLNRDSDLDSEFEYDPYRHIFHLLLRCSDAIN